MTQKGAAVVFVAAGILTLLAGCKSEPNTSFQHDVAPVLSKYCDECHLPGGEGAQESGFTVETYDSVMKGTKYGPVVVAGDSTSSTLYRLVSGQVDESIQMPHGKDTKLHAEEIQLIQLWIDQGANNN